MLSTAKAAYPVVVRISSISYYPPFEPLIVPRLYSWLVPLYAEGLHGLCSPSSGSPPNRNAFSRLPPLNGRFPDAKNGDEAIGEEDLALVMEDSSGSSIKANEDCASVDRVGIGARGRAGIAKLPPLDSDGVVDEEGDVLGLGTTGASITFACGGLSIYDVLCANESLCSESRRGSLFACSVFEMLVDFGNDLAVIMFWEGSVGSGILESSK